MLVDEWRVFFFIPSFISLLIWYLAVVGPIADPEIGSSLVLLSCECVVT